MNLRQPETRVIGTAASPQDAAWTFSVSHPAVSRTLPHAQTSLGVVLFERRKGRLVPGRY